MTTKRIKVPLPAPRTREEAEALVGSIAASVNAQIAINAEMDGRILAIKKEYENPLAVLNDAIQLKTVAVREWAEANPDQFPKSRKSIEFVQGFIGFRTGTPKLALLNRSWNWEKVLAAVKRLMPEFIREHPEVDKEAIIIRRENALVRATLPECGLKVVQDETFFVEPKLTEVETRQTAEAKG